MNNIVDGLEVLDMMAKNYATIKKVLSKLILIDENESRLIRVEDNGTGFWVSIPYNGKNWSVGMHIRCKNCEPAINVNINSLMAYEDVKGTPSVDELLDVMYDLIDELDK